jgi:hypothetical protein
MKSRLDAINSNFGTNPCISFRQVPIKQNEFSYSYQRMWAAGYPFIYDGGDTTHFTKKCAEIDHINLHTSANVGHNTDDGNDIADEYVAKTGQMDIGPGASGSMVIDRFGEVIGIYWGKYYNSSNNWGAADILISDGFGSHSSYNIIDNNPYK